MKYDSNIPIYLQVIDSLKKRMIAGEINPGDKLPSTRMLAIEYEINPNTAARVYKEIELQGLCFTKRGEGTFVTDEKDLIKRIRDEKATEVLKQFITEMTGLGFDKTTIIKKLNEKEF